MLIIGLAAKLRRDVHEGDLLVLPPFNLIIQQFLSDQPLGSGKCCKKQEQRYTSTLH
jgi:hypothetical protein